ncbi:polyprotein [Sclerotium rolfsii alphavirus-like virus 3]|uniref:Polyprotein n=1 Tax=Sclerotium rolfsii alphavirus-like virus 3 TaxID=2490820 RepID=A0A3G8EYJ7_9VIRU|nr:polyprotein [Sclerotium rolfsii alphavirus-like virus 3]
MLYRSAGLWAARDVQRLFAEQQPSPGVDAWDSLTVCFLPARAVEPLRPVTPREAAAALFPPVASSRSHRKKYAVCSWHPRVETIVTPPPSDDVEPTARSSWRSRVHRPRSPPKLKGKKPTPKTPSTSTPAEHGPQCTTPVIPPSRPLSERPRLRRPRICEPLRVRPESNGSVRRRLRAFRSQFAFLDVTGIRETFNLHYVESIERLLADAIGTPLIDQLVDEMIAERYSSGEPIKVGGDADCWRAMFPHAHAAWGDSFAELASLQMSVQFGMYPPHNMFCFFDDRFSKDWLIENWLTVNWIRMSLDGVIAHISEVCVSETRPAGDHWYNFGEFIALPTDATDNEFTRRVLTIHASERVLRNDPALYARLVGALPPRHVTSVEPVATYAAAEPTVAAHAAASVAREIVANYWQHALDKFNGGLPLGDNVPVHTLDERPGNGPKPPPGPLPEPEVPGRTPDNDEWMPSFPGEDSPYDVVPTQPGPFIPREPLPDLPPPDHTPFPVPHPPDPPVPTPYPPGPLPAPQPDLPTPAPHPVPPDGHGPPIPIDVGQPQFEFPPLDIHAPTWVTHYMQVLHDAGMTLAGAASEVASGAAHVAPFVMPVLRLLQYYMQDYNQAHNNHRMYRGSDLGVAAARYADSLGDMELHAAICAVAEPGRDIIVGTDPYYLALSHEQGMFGEGDNGSRALATRVMTELNAAATARGNLPLLKVHQNTPRQAHLALSRAWPEFRCLTVNSTHPHGAAQSNRTAMLGFTSALINRRFPGERVRGIGLSPRQCAALPNLVHNCAPVLTGRDEYRHNHAYDRACTNAFRVVSRDHKFEDCHMSCAPVAIAIHSTGDIPLVHFAEECIKSGVHTAFVVMNLPVVMLDKRITRYTDTDNGFVYQRDGDQLQMFFRGAASPGYVNSFGATISWARPMPLIPGYHVQLEELKRFGTTFLFELRLSRGAQETLPTMFSTEEDDFMVLPMLRPGWRQEDGHRRDFAVPARRFRALVSFVSTIEPGKIVFQPVANKLRGQLGEVRIGKTVVENRWDLEADEFYSVVGHAITANQLFARDYAEVMPALSDNITRAYQRHSRNILVRGQRYLRDLFTFQLAKKAEIDATDGWDWLLDALTATKLDHGQLSNPYVSRKHYQIINDELIHDDPSVLGGLANTAREAVEFGQYVFAANNSMFETMAKILRPYDPDVWLQKQLAPRTPTWRDIENANTEELERFVGILDPHHDVDTPPPTEISHEPSTIAPNDSVSVRGIEAVVPAQPAAPVTPAPEPAPTPPPASTITSHHVAHVTHASADDGGPVVEQPPPDVAVVAAPSPEPIGVTSPVEFGSDPDVDPPASVPSSVSTQASTVSFEAEVTRDRGHVGNAPLIVDENGHTLTDAFELDVDMDALAECQSQAPFEPQYSLYPQPVLSEASAAFVRAAPDSDRLDELIRLGRFDLPAPDRGMKELVNTIVTRVAVQRFHHQPLDDAAIALEAEHFWTGDDVNQLQAKIMSFYKDPRTREPYCRLPQLCIDGIAGSAKSSVVCEWLREHGEFSLVVVPGRNLRKQWADKLAPCRTALVVTQHELPKSPSFKYLVIDEAFTFGAHHLRAWLAFAQSVKARVVLLGDRFQRHPTAQLYPVDHEVYTARVLRLTVSNTIPLDAMLVFRRQNNLGGVYASRSEVFRSIRFYDSRFSDRIDHYVEGLRLSATRSFMAGLNGAISIGQSQGLRSADVTIGLPPEGGAADWLRQHNGARNVAFTRHSVCLNVLVHPSKMRDLVFGIDVRPCTYVNGIRLNRLLGQRQVYPFDLDLLPTYRELGDQHVEINAPGLPLDASRRHGEHLTSFNSTYEPPVHGDPEYMLEPGMHEIQGLVYERTNVDSVKDHEHAVGFNTGHSPGLHSVGEVSALVTRNDMRNIFDDAHKFADVQVSNSTFEDLRNILERQLQKNKSPHTSGGTWRDAAAIFKRWCECFLSSEFVTHEGIDDFAVRWLSTRTPAFLQRLFDSPFSENGASVRFHAFLKQQTKFKATPGFAASVNYGQEIIANEAPYSAVLAPGALMVYRRVSECMRKDFIADIGMSDEELAEKMRRQGLLDDLYQCNMQIDVEKQDSSHSAEHVLGFCMLIEFLGFPPELAELYFEHCSQYAVVSQHEHLFKCTISFNLASGDPFTLIRNFFQMTSTLACRYSDTDVARGVQKGDDLIVDRHLRKRHVLSLLPSVAAVVFKEDFDMPPYHAGRFVHPLGLFVDPVRAVAKHLTRVTNENVPTAELHRSYVSRATVWPAEIQEYLRHVLPVHYPDFTGEQVELVLRIAHFLRDWRFFRATHDFVPVVKLTVESETDCAVTVARAVFPGRDRQFYRRFRGRDAASLVALFAEHGVSARLVPSLSLADPTLTGVLVSPTHCLYRRSLTAQRSRFYAGASYGL